MMTSLRGYFMSSSMYELPDVDRRIMFDSYEADLAVEVEQRVGRIWGVINEAESWGLIRVQWLMTHSDSAAAKTYYINQKALLEVFDSLGILDGYYNPDTFP